MAHRDASKISPRDLTAAQAKAELKRLAYEIALNDKRYYQLFTVIIFTFILLLR